MGGGGGGIRRVTVGECWPKYIIFRRRATARIYIYGGFPGGNEGFNKFTSVSILIKALVFYCTLLIIILCLFHNLNCLISNTMGFFRTLQQKAHEHKSSTVTAAKEAEENASFTGSYATLLSEYVLIPFNPSLENKECIANSSRKQKVQQKTQGGGDRVYNYNRKYSFLSPLVFSCMDADDA